MVSACGKTQHQKLMNLVNLWIDDIHGNGQSWRLYVRSFFDAIEMVDQIRSKNPNNCLWVIYQHSNGEYRNL